MAKIRLGDFGSRVAGPAPAERVPAGAFVQENGLAEGAQRGSLTLLADAKQEHNRQFEELRRAKSVQAYAGFQADVDELTTDLTGQLANKAIKREEIDGLFTKGVEDAKKARLDSLDTEQQATVGAHFMTAERGARIKLRAAAQLDVKQERTAAINGALEEYQRLGVREPAKAVEQANMLLDTEGPGVLGADKVAAGKQSFAERVYATHFTERLNQLRYDANGLATLEQDVQGNQVLDPDKKNVLLGRIGGFRETLAARADRAEQGRLRVIEHQIDANDKMILAGFAPSAEQLLATSEAAKGTPYEPVARAQIEFAKQSTRFAAMPPRAQEAFLTDYEAKVRERPTPDGIKSLDAYKTIARNQQDLVKNDPISFAGSHGLADVQPLDLSRLDALDDQLRARVTIGRGMQAQYGSPLKVLTKEEATMFANFMQKGTSEDKAKMLGSLRSALGDQDAYMATMQQIAPDHPAAAWAGSLIGRRPYVEHNLIRSDVETQSQRGATLILRGESLLNPSATDKKADGRAKPFPMPADKDMLSGFNDQARDAYRGRSDAFNVAWQSARNVYAALSEDAGDVSGEFKADRWQQAVNVATGGFTDFNGARVVRPYGLGEDEFKDAVYKQLGTLAASGRVGLDRKMLARMQLESAGDAKYLVRGGTGYLLDKTGQPVVLDLFQQTFAGLVDAKGKPVTAEVPR